IWNLADLTRDGYLDLYEYGLARHFIEMKLEGFELPASLPEALLPSYDLHEAATSSPDLRDKTRDAPVDERMQGAFRFDSISRCTTGGAGTLGNWAGASSITGDSNPLSD
ncbi:sarcalumenin/eps15 family protein, partial [Toxoplasma gondii CAST]